MIFILHCKFVGLQKKICFEGGEVHQIKPCPCCRWTKNMFLYSKILYILFTELLNYFYLKATRAQGSGKEADASFRPAMKPQTNRAGSDERV